ncbi:MAG: retention module-containing protein, partial [Betaproteobacteria bacterium]|nr:retention module-containing protein [Betaproteobacteria bacterium]
MLTRATLTNPIGTIHTAIGEATIVGVDGATRVAHIGDKVFPREMILTSANAVVHVQLDDGRMLDIGQESEVSLNADATGAANIMVAQAATQPGAAAMAAIPAATGKVVGTITIVVGNVKIIGADGVERIAKVGDKVLANESLATGADGIIQVQLVNGKMIDLGRESTLALTDALIAEAGAAAPGLAPTVPTVVSPEDAAAQAKAQAAAEAAKIAAGADPTQVTEATAAGGAPAAGGGADGGGGTPVIIDQANSTGQVTSGFTTRPANLGFPAVQPELLPEAEEAETLPTVGLFLEPGVLSSTDVFSIVDGGSLTGSGGGGDIISIPVQVGIIDPLFGNAATVVEGTNEAQNKTMSIIMMLDRDEHDVDVQVTYQVTPVTAVAPDDFDTVLVGTLTIPAGAAFVIVQVQIVQDAILEGIETFRVTLIDAVNATIDPNANTVIGTIIDDDARPVTHDETAGVDADANDVVSASATITSAFGATSLGGANSGVSVHAEVPAQKIFADENGQPFTGQDSGLQVTGGSSIYLYSETVNGVDFIVGREGGENAADPEGAVAFVVALEADESTSLVQYLAIDHGEDGNDFDSSVGTDIIHVAVVLENGTVVSTTTSVNVSFQDDGPAIDVSAAEAADPLVVDETSLAANASANFSDNFSDTHDFGSDGEGAISTTYSLNVSSSGVDTGLDDVATGQDVLLFLESGQVVGRVGSSEGAMVFTVSVDAETGVVTLVQQRTVSHDVDGPPGPAHDDAMTLGGADLITLTRSSTITDADGDNASDSATINIGTALSFKDDGPSIDVSVTGEVDAIGVDETSLAANASANFADNFVDTHDFGADGEGTISTSYSLSTSGGASGLTDVATGQAVTLHMNGAVVEGRVSDGEGGFHVVFTVAVDAATGTVTVTLDQQRAVKHPNAENPDDAVTLSDADLITLTRSSTITDRDGDTASDSASISIGQALSFKDDGPAIDVSVTAAADALGVDETNLGANASASFADNFADTHDFGADGAGSISTSYSLSTSGGASGLTDVATGQAVTLHLNGAVVEGRVSDGEGGFHVVFTVSVDTNGTVTLDQQRAVAHDVDGPPGPAHDDAVTLSNADLITLTRSSTITDADGDTASDSASIGIGQALSFEDDGPSIDVSATAVADALVVDETNLEANASANFADNFGDTHSFGADDAGSISTSYSLSVKSAGVDSGLDDVATGLSVNLYVIGGVVVGSTALTQGAVTAGNTVFTVSVDAATGTVTLDQQRAVAHDVDGSPGLAHDDAMTLSAVDLITLTRSSTITDRDGDTASDSASIGIAQALSFEDDGPAVSSNLGVQLDDDALAGGNVGGTGDDANAVNTSGTLAHSYGADGGSIAYLTTGAPEGFTYQTSGDDLLVMQGETTVLTLTLNTATGAYTVTQNAPIVHVDGLDENNQAFTINYRVTDGDGDTADGTLSINVDDDTPTAQPEPVQELHENTSIDGQLDFSRGADGGRVTDVEGTPVPASGTVIIDGDHGTLEIDALGNYTYTADESVVGSVTEIFSFTVTDGDGDPVTLETGLTFRVVDANTPLVGVSTATVDEDGLTGGIAGGTGDESLPTPENVFVGTLVGFSYGADGRGATGGVELSGGPLPISLLDGPQVVATWNPNTSTLTGMAGQVKVFDIVVDQADGDYTVTLYQPIEHQPGDNENDAFFTVGITITDADGSQDTGSLTVTIDDDTPIAVVSREQQDVGGTVEEEALGEENPVLSVGNQELEDSEPDTTVAQGSVASLFQSGADAPLSFSLTDDTSSLESQELSSKDDPLSYAVTSSTDEDTGVTTYTLTATAGTVEDEDLRTVFTLELTSDGEGAGSYTFTLFDQLDHATGDAENPLSINLAPLVVATDADGDSVGRENGFSITVVDDVPVQTQEGVSGAVDEDELNNALGVGNPDGDLVGTFATGSLAGMVSVGADEEASFSLSLEDAVPPSITSKGAPLSYVVNEAGDTLIAFVNNGGGAGFDEGTDRPVFTLQVDGAGGYNFTLLDQIDHPVGGPLSEQDPVTERDNETLTLDLSSFVVATDRDGDSITLDGGFTITVEDDIPERASNPTLVHATVEEDGMSTATGDAGDKSEGNKDPDPLIDSNADDQAFGIAGSLNGLVSIGADERSPTEPIRFSITSNPDVINGLPTFYSKGEALTYQVVASETDGNSLNGNDTWTLTATAGEEARIVFTLVVNKDGSWSFDLDDQLDHVDDGTDSENIALVATVGDESTSFDALDFSSIIVVTDRDGDSRRVLEDGDFTITVEDDIPANTDSMVTGAVDEDELSNAQGTGNTDGDGVGITATGAL